MATANSVVLKGSGPHQQSNIDLSIKKRNNKENGGKKTTETASLLMLNNTIDAQGKSSVKSIAGFKTVPKP